MDFLTFSREIARLRPDLVLFTVMSINWELVKELARIAKEEVASYNICGGYHPTLCPEDVIQCEHVDAICLGEGDNALVDVVQAMDSGTGFFNTPNFWFKDNDKIYKNAPRPLEEDLDLLPYWDREIFQQFDIHTQTGTALVEMIRPGFFPAEAITLNTYSGRGCYYKCTYCTNKAMLDFNKGLGHYVRHRSPMSIIQELLLLCGKYNPDYIEFYEEHFPTNKKWIEEFAKGYVSISRPFGINYRLDNANRDNLRLLAEAGCKFISYGLECGNEEYRRHILNRNVSNDQIIKGAGLAREFGIGIITYNMVGLPYETASDIRATIDLNRRIKPLFPTFATFQPFPMTKLYDLCREEDLLLQDNFRDYRDTNPTLKLAVTNSELAMLWQDIRNLQEECLASHESSHRLGN
jgi:anaerobic magnesium-protoporphyrin IX monomethyl ester cyclase